MISVTYHKLSSMNTSITYSVTHDLTHNVQSALISGGTMLSQLWVLRWRKLTALCMAVLFLTMLIVTR